jgi:SAM-dependent methyltransferase
MSPDVAAVPHGGEVHSVTALEAGAKALRVEVRLQRKTPAGGGAAIVEAGRECPGIDLCRDGAISRRAATSNGGRSLAADEILRVRDIELRFRGGMHKPPESGEGYLYVHKDMAFVTAMDEILARVRPQSMIEIGIHDGGSTAYWHHKYGLRRLAAFDILPEARFFARYLARNGLTDAVRLHLGVAQTDRARMRAAVAGDFGCDPVDAIIDDASHEYAPTKAAFEMTFPFLRPGGVYIIEDWAWGHQQRWPPDSRADMPLMSPLLTELMLVCGHATGVIEKMEINERFAAVWRGTAELAKDRFRLEDHLIARGFAVDL